MNTRKAIHDFAKFKSKSTINLKIEELRNILQIHEYYKNIYFWKPAKTQKTKIQREKEDTIDIKLGKIKINYWYKYYEDNRKLDKPKVDRDSEDRRKFNTYHMDNFIEQNKDNLEDITLQELKKLVKDYKITNDLIKEKKQELKESEQKLAETYEELATLSAETDKLKYVQSTIGNIVASSNKLDILFEDDYKPIIQDVDMKKELEVNLVHIRDKINNLLNEINLEKYNCGNIIDIENYTTEG